MFHQLTILGPGLLGGSLALAARERGLAGCITCWSRSGSTRARCAEAAWCDRVAETARDAVAGSDLVVICTPVNTISALAGEIADALEEGCLVTDVGSTKAQVVADTRAALAGRAGFVGSHPMAGSEKTGLEHARGDLFAGRPCLMTPADGDDPELVGRLRSFWEAVGMRVSLVSPREHDRIVAHISHLPHLVASALSAALAGTETQWAAYSAGGLRDTTRVAAGDPGLWREIFEHNRGELVAALDSFESVLADCRRMLESGEFDALERLLSTAKRYRDELPGAGH